MNEINVEYCRGSTVSPLQWPRPRATVSAFVIMMNFATTTKNTVAADSQVNSLFKWNMSEQEMEESPPDVHHMSAFASSVLVHLMSKGGALRSSES